MTEPEELKVERLRKRAAAKRLRRERETPEERRSRLEKETPRDRETKRRRQAELEQKQDPLHEKRLLRDRGQFRDRDLGQLHLLGQQSQHMAMPPLHWMADMPPGLPPGLAVAAIPGDYQAVSDAGAFYHPHGELPMTIMMPMNAHPSINAANLTASMAAHMTEEMNARGEIAMVEQMPYDFVAETQDQQHHQQGSHL
jgi:hypothetical protein